MFVLLILIVLAFPTPPAGAQANSGVDALVGTWSGGWTPAGKVRDSVTVEFKKDAGGKLTGRFLTPFPVDFSSASFNSKTRVLEAQAVDEKSGRQLKLNGKVEGTELNGTLVSNDLSGEVLLIKWTYVPRIGGL